MRWQSDGASTPKRLRPYARGKAGLRIPGRANRRGDAWPEAWGTCGLLLIATFISIQLAACGIRKASDRPNVLLITLDTTRADRIGAYGYHRDATPHLDRLAEEGVLFEQVTSQSAVTPVSHASILTGLYPQNHELRSLHGGIGYRLPEAVETLPEILKEAGYRTAAFVSAFPASSHYGLNQGFDHWDEDFAGIAEAALASRGGIVNTGSAQRGAGPTTSRAIAWLSALEGERFLGWIHFFDPHDSVLAPPERFTQRFPPQHHRRDEVLRALYDAELNFVDLQISHIVQALDEFGVLENTLIIVIADHGQGLGDHNWWGHSILYQEQIRVPLIMKGPGVPPGRRIESNVRSIDLVPTVLDLVEVTPPAPLSFDGESLIPLIEQAESEPRPAFSESINDLSGYEDSPFQNRSLYAFREQDWKLIVHREGGEYVRFELYDLEADPFERADLSQSHPDRVRAMTRILESQGIYQDEIGKPELGEAARAKLAKLGYLD